MKSKIGTTNHFSIVGLTVSLILIVCHATEAFEPWKDGHFLNAGIAELVQSG
jgi:hypothetical protein